MASAIQTPGQYERHAQAREKIIDQEIREALERSLTKLIVAVRGIPEFPIQTGNLQNSVGVNRRVAASKTPLGNLPQSGEAVDLKGLIRHQRKQGRWVVFFRIGMVYAKHVLDGRGIVEPVLKDHREVFTNEVQEAIAHAIKRIGEEL